MTTVYDLEKQATPGKLEVQVTENCDWRVSLVSPYKNSAEYVATLTTQQVFREDSNPDPKKRMLSNAQMLKHCRNHFMEALAGLREVADMIQYETSFDSPAYKRCWELIAKLEEVK